VETTKPELKTPGVPAFAAIRVIATLLFVVSCADGADSYAFTGTVMNTTDPNRPIASQMQLMFGQDGSCSIMVSLPLTGSGPCAFTSYDEKSGRFEMTSTGAAAGISWKGTFNGAILGGSYVCVPGTPTPGMLHPNLNTARKALERARVAHGGHKIGHTPEQRSGAETAAIRAIA
jgi:hypothetical protein